MAEGWARRLKTGEIEAYSAGVEPKALDERAVQVMAEAGVDIGSQHAKGVDEVRAVDFDYVVTVCDNAHESCPVFGEKARMVHVAFDDPPRLARSASTRAEAMDHYRRVRDEIRRFVERLPGALTDAGSAGKSSNGAAP